MADMSLRISSACQLTHVAEYWREYRTYFHIGQARGISESAASLLRRWRAACGRREYYERNAIPQR
jgi:hypothetical protein